MASCVLAKLLTARAKMHLDYAPRTPLLACQMLNWDWLHNRPAHPPQGEEAAGQGWWVNLKQMFRLPLLDDTGAPHAPINTQPSRCSPSLLLQRGAVQACPLLWRGAAAEGVPVPSVDMYAASRCCQSPHCTP